MHLLFEIKQAHLAAMKLARAQTSPLGLTPARLHLLHALLAVEARGDACSQAELVKELRVTKPVVSIMARALERLGFLERSRSTTDGRRYLVRSTDRARKALHAFSRSAARTRGNEAA